MTALSQTAPARKLMLNEYQGILSTHSFDVPGYPFGSVAPYCHDSSGRPVILISDIAQHTKNINAESKVSLTLTESGIDDSQTGARLTLLADAEKLDPQGGNAAERYYRYFPQSQDYHKTHNFYFYALNVVKARFIGGFGDIHWIKPEVIVKASPFSPEDERGMVDHMNRDHMRALAKYCDDADIDYSEKHPPQMVGVVGDGFHLRIGARLFFFPFKSLALTAMDVRKHLVDMAK